ncbi:hypothetical protein ABENE_00785 [Asticcacaulis benevestitus DSM 16100 = ATCC BAA-896]|uniref:Uncharacterized protein n=1 Tax=Asticcacaulis benevestitus DSM 16100 = ATCC BAA-896 TaxID=1121022 RepID=V4Q212_9CAUL|nr:hypothetical protein ABENE_00785 [Asticcacaulis benevestitus DSM 16100 = ATCC BAA-896]
MVQVLNGPRDGAVFYALRDRRFLPMLAANKIYRQVYP